MLLSPTPSVADAPETETPEATPRRLRLQPPADLLTNAEIAAWYLEQGRRVVMPRKEGSRCEEITADYVW